MISYSIGMHHKFSEFLINAYTLIRHCCIHALHHHSVVNSYNQLYQLICCVLFLFNLQAFSLGVLIAASVAVSAINEVEDFFGPFASEFGFEADSYRGAAGWLIFVASTALLYHIAMIIVRCLYIASVIEKHLTIYGVIVSAHDYKDIFIVIYNGI